MTDTRLAAIQAGQAEGLSLRAIARSLGLSDKSVRNALRTAADAPPPTAEVPQLPPIAQPQSATGAAAKTMRTTGYVPPEERPTTLPLRIVGGVNYGVEPSPDDAYRKCPYCGHIAWRTAPGSAVYECACYSPMGRACHAVVKRFSDFPAVLPPEAA